MRNYHVALNGRVFITQRDCISALAQSANRNERKSTCKQTHISVTSPNLNLHYPRRGYFITSFSFTGQPILKKKIKKGNAFSMNLIIFFKRGFDPLF